MGRERYTQQDLLEPGGTPHLIHQLQTVMQKITAPAKLNSGLFLVSGIDFQGVGSAPYSFPISNSYPNERLQGYRFLAQYFFKRLALKYSGPATLGIQCSGGILDTA